MVFTFIFKGCISEKDNSFISVSYSNDLAIEDGFDGRLLLMFSKKLNKNGISLIFPNNNQNIKFIGTANKEKADYIYSNYFYEIDSRYNKKYNIPNNFYLFKSLYIDGIKVYSIYKKTS